MDEILKCPFCQNLTDPELVEIRRGDGQGCNRAFWVSCPFCKARGPRDSKAEEAIGIWNDMAKAVFEPSGLEQVKTAIGSLNLHLAGHPGSPASYDEAHAALMVVHRFVESLKR